ncbi:MAG TPA: EAL domain-containing protein [Terriglobales bacterium]|nr:EAL domain-containing protein [Terriglobales bacterium]
MAYPADKLTAISGALIDSSEFDLLWRFCDSGKEAIALFDENDRLLRWNDACLRLFHNLEEQIAVGAHLDDLVRESFNGNPQFRSAAARDELVRQSLQMLRKDGADYTRFVPERGWMRSRVFHLSTGGWLRIWSDANSETEVERGRFDLTKMLGSVGIGYALFDHQQRFISCNELYLHFFPKVEAYCRTTHGYHDHAVAIAETLEQDSTERFTTGTQAVEPADLDLRLRQSSNGWLALEQRVLENGGGLICLWRDATRQHEYEQHLTQLAYHNSESGLPNEASLRQHLNTLSETTQDITLICVQVVDFKILRSTFGMDIAEQILVLFATRLSSESNLWLAHLGTSDFMLVLKSRAAHQVTEMTERIRAVTEQPIAFGRRQVTLRTRIGVAVMNTPERDIGDLIEDAEIAAVQADSTDHKGPVFFDPSIRTALMLRHEIEADLRQALHNDDEIWLAYQPIVQMHNGRLAGFEALARWSHPTRGMISPSDFIPIAEWSGLIVPLGQMVFRRACEQLVAWKGLGIADDFFISVNLSALQMAHPQLISEIGWILEQTGAQAKHIKLELTESSVMHNPDSAIQVIDRLRQMGFRISIDDFGTGYSSLSHLHRLPIDSLKIDQSFIRPLTDAARNLEMARLIIELGHLLRLEVVAEGIERSSHMELLKGLGCDLGQGYLFSRPIPAGEAQQMIFDDDIARSTF